MKCARAIFSSAVCQALLYFSTLSHTRHDFRGKKVTENTMCILIFTTDFVWNTRHNKNNSAGYYHKWTYVFMYSTPLFLYNSKKKKNLNFHNRFSKNIHIPNLINIRLVLDELFHAEWRTDMAKLMADFRDFPYASKNSPEAVIFQLQAPRIIGNFSDTRNVRVVGMKNCRLECILPKS